MTNKKAFIFGVAMHTSTDTFAHSTYRYYNGTMVQYKRMQLTKKKVSIRKMRQTILSLYQKDLIWHIVQREIHYIVNQGKRSDVAVCHDFHAANDPDKYYPSNPAFKVKRISKYGTQVHLSDANVIAHFATINYN